MNPPTTDSPKYCYRCKQWRTRGDFGISRERYDGLQSRCRDCIAADRKRKYNAMTSEQLKDHQRRVNGILAEKRRKQRIQRVRDAQEVIKWFDDHGYANIDIHRLTGVSDDRIRAIRKYGPEHKMQQRTVNQLVAGQAEAINQMTDRRVLTRRQWHAKLG